MSTFAAQERSMKIIDSYYGDLSAIMIDNLPFWAELSSTPSSKTSLIPEWEDKVKAIIKESMNQKVTSFAGVPSWMLSLLQQVIDKTGKDNILEIWQDAEVYFHGGVSFEPYRNLYNKLFHQKILNILKFLMPLKVFLLFRIKIAQQSYC